MNKWRRNRKTKADLSLELAIAEAKVRATSVMLDLISEKNTWERLAYLNHGWRDATIALLQQQTGWSVVEIQQKIQEMSWKDEMTRDPETERAE